MSTAHTPILIIGGGLAGCVLAHELLDRGEDFILLSKQELSTSSLVAPGVWNPVVYKRMTKSWMADDLIPHLHSFYQKAEIRLNKKFLQKRKTLRFFTEEQEAILWKKKSKEGLSVFIEEEIFSPDQLSLPGIKKPEAGFAFIHESGNIDTGVFIRQTLALLSEEGKFYNEEFDSSALHETETGFEYKDIRAEKIIFCEGWLQANNPWFKEIPFKPAKGELFIFECNELKTDFIISKQAGIVPYDGNLYKCGATYEWNNLNEDITESAQEDLEKKLQQILQLPYKVVDRKAGIRPSVIDRRPVLGEHPRHKNMYNFNGFGTKGVMLGPFFAKQLCNFIESGIAVSAEADVKRFFK